MAAEPEGVEQPVHHATRAHDRQRIRRVTFDAAPGADDVEFLGNRYPPLHLAHLIEHAFRLDKTPAVDHVVRAALAAADDDVAARYLPKIDHLLFDFGEHADHRGQ